MHRTNGMTGQQKGYGEASLAVASADKLEMQIIHVLSTWTT